LDRRFHAACTRILKPARGFFDKRDALRSEHRQLVDRLLAEAEAELGPAEGAATSDDSESDARVAAVDIDTTRLLELQKQATSQLRQLDRLAPGERRETADRLRALLDRIRPQLEA